jgi:hypothetical protein
MIAAGAAAALVSRDGKCVLSSFGSDRWTMPVASSVEVASDISTVPSSACFWPAGVMVTAARAVSVLGSGHYTACG